MFAEMKVSLPSKHQKVIFNREGGCCYSLNFLRRYLYPLEYWPCGFEVAVVVAAAAITD
jgi:arylamine N-acetyltransferase